MLVLRDTGLLREVTVRRLLPGYSLHGRISGWWWLLLGLRHLWVRKRLREALPALREITGYTLNVESIWVT